MTNHVTHVMTHFRGKVVAWDVVNEAWNDDGMSMRNSVFQQRLGSGFVDEAFQAARAADLPRPLLWDKGYQKKPAYTGVVDALIGR